MLPLQQEINLKKNRTEKLVQNKDLKSEIQNEDDSKQVELLYFMAMKENSKNQIKGNLNQHIIRNSIFNLLNNKKFYPKSEKKIEPNLTKPEQNITNLTKPEENTVHPVNLAKNINPAKTTEDLSNPNRTQSKNDTIKQLIKSEDPTVIFYHLF